MSITRFVLTPVFLGVTFLVFYADYAFGTVIFSKTYALLFSCLALHELFAMYGKRDSQVREPLAYPCMALAFFADYILALIVFIAAVALVNVTVRRPVCLDDVGTAGRRGVGATAKIVFFYAYVSLLSLAFQTGSVGDEKLPWFFLFIVAANKGNDSSAYLVGKAIGKTQLTEISPRKTVEGFIGGLLGGTILGYAAIIYTPMVELSQNELSAVIVCFCVTLSASMGDLFESWLKRNAGVKDSAGLIPEFGGFLDLLDSFLLSVPVAYVLMKHAVLLGS